MDVPKFFNPYDEIKKHGFELPHWQQSGATYFVTFRLADSLPESQLGSWREERKVWLSLHPQPWKASEEAEYHRRFSRAIDLWLDRGAGACLLRQSEVSRSVANVLLHDQGDKYMLHGFVIMPNHVHILASFRAEQAIEQILKSWKGVSARSVNKITASTGTVWQRNYFDRIVRDHDHYFRVAGYIRRNPFKAKLSPNEYLLWESDHIRTMLGPM